MSNETLSSEKTTRDAGSSKTKGKGKAKTNSTLASKGQSKDVNKALKGKKHATKQAKAPTGPEGQGPNTVTEGAATETNSNYKSYATILAGSLSDFDDYAYAQADWSMGIAKEADKTTLRSVLSFLREDSNYVTALGSDSVAKFVADGAGKLDAMRAYGAAYTESKETLKVRQATSVADARDLGTDIAKLEAKIQGPVLKWIFTPAAFDRLRTEAGNQVQDFADYAATPGKRPMLQAKEGTEINSYLKLSAAAKPASFSDIKDVRNYHRFEEPALQGLRMSQKGNTTNKPMTLVLQSNLDYNGAFHHDPEMTAVIAEPTNHTVLLEGATKLSQITDRLPSLVKKHGREEPAPAKKGKKGRKVKKIDQLMIAGHGSSTGIELAGDLQTDNKGNVQTASDGELLTHDGGLEIGVNPKDPKSVKLAKESTKFLEEVMTYMSADPSTPHGRIVFNACLTASNEIDPATINGAKSVKDQQALMRKAYIKNPSIVDKTRAIAKKLGKKTSVLGGNASFGVVGLMDKTGGLDIVADGQLAAGGKEYHTDDPELTNQDKFVYVEKGTEPSGIMLAVAECWSLDQAKTLKAVKARRGAPLNTSWSELVIQTLYELVETKHSKNGAMIAAMAQSAHGLKELGGGGRSWPFWQFPSDWNVLEKNFSGHAAWKANEVQLVFYQARFVHDRDKASLGNYLAAVAKMSLRDAAPYLWTEAVQQLITTLLPAKANATPNGGRLRIALFEYFRSGSGMAARTKSYLSSLVTAGKFTVNVAGPMAGLRSEDQLLMALGLHPRQQVKKPKTPKSPVSTKTPLPEANVDMTKSGKNDSYVESLSVTGVVTASSLYVHAQPSLKGRRLSRLFKRGEKIYVMGRSGDWFFVDLDGKRGYAYAKYVKLQSP